METAVRVVFAQIYDYGVPLDWISDIRKEFNNTDKLMKHRLINDIARLSMKAYVTNNMEFFYNLPAMIEAYNRDTNKIIAAVRKQNAKKSKTHYHSNKGKFKCIFCPNLKCCSLPSRFQTHCNSKRHLRKLNAFLKQLPADVRQIIGEFSKGPTKYQK